MAGAGAASARITSLSRGRARGRRWIERVPSTRVHRCYRRTHQQGAGEILQGIGTPAKPVEGDDAAAEQERVERDQVERAPVVAQGQVELPRFARYSDRMTLLETALERIVAVAQPDRVILFGSVARGETGPQSDLDFLVIKRGVASRRRLAQAIDLALIGVPASSDIVVVTPEDVDALEHGVAAIIGPAVREGREVYAA